MKGGGGKIAVIGSVHIFSDIYIDKEENKKWFEDLIDYLTDVKAVLDLDRDIEVQLSSSAIYYVTQRFGIKITCSQVAEYATVPNIIQLSQQARVCLTESEEVPPDWTSLFQTKRNVLISRFQNFAPFST